jgi:hypothetical protein
MADKNAEDREAILKHIKGISESFPDRDREADGWIQAGSHITVIPSTGDWG